MYVRGCGAALRARGHFQMKPFIANTTYLTEQLRPWLEYFDDGTAGWGLITDVRSDGSTFKRHGVVVELTVANPEKAIHEQLEKESNVERGGQLREAIDLIKLVLAVEPMVMTPLLLKYADAPYDEDDLRQLFQKHTPVELRVRIDFGYKVKSRYLKERLATRFIQQLSGRSPWTSDEIRRRLIALAHQNLKDVPGFKASSYRRLRHIPVPMTIMMNHGEPGKSYHFFADLTDVATTLQLHRKHQQDMPWSMTELHAPLVVEEFDIAIDDMSVTRGVTQAAAALLATGMRVACPLVSLDVRRITCGEEDLTVFLRGITRETLMVHVHTGRVGLFDDQGYEDEGDWRASIRSMLNGIAAIERPVTIDLSGMLTVWRHVLHRKVIFSGLFEAIFMRSSPTSLTIRSHVMEAEDSSEVYQCRREWRLRNPTKPIRVASLNISLADNESEHALLTVIDDVHNLTLSDISQKPDTILSALRFPSLRRLKVRRLSIDSMDLFDPSVEDPRLPNKPCLEFLEIEGLKLGKPESLKWFIKRLDPTVEAPSLLATTLHTLGITEYVRIEIDRRADLNDPYLCVRLALHDASVVDTLQEVCKTNRTLRDVNFVGDFGYWFPELDRFPDGRVKCDHHLPAPPSVRRTQAAKARNASFMSVIRAAAQARASAIGRVDSRTVQRILDFSAPHAYCTLKVKP